VGLGIDYVRELFEEKDSSVFPKCGREEAAMSPHLDKKLARRVRQN
jgi:hypothetical protein